MQLTERQEEALVFIANFKEDHGYPPTLREIGNEMGIGSTNGVVDHLKALERKGCLERVPLRSRGLMLTTAGERFVNPKGASLDHAKVIETVAGMDKETRRLFASSIATREAGRVQDGSDAMYAWNRVWHAIQEAKEARETKD